MAAKKVKLVPRLPHYNAYGLARRLEKQPFHQPARARRARMQSRRRR